MSSCCGVSAGAPSSLTSHPGQVTLAQQQLSRCSTLQVPPLVSSPGFSLCYLLRIWSVQMYEDGWN